MKDLLTMNKVSAKLQMIVKYSICNFIVMIALNLIRETQLSTYFFHTFSKDPDLG